MQCAGKVCSTSTHRAGAVGLAIESGVKTSLHGNRNPRNGARRSSGSRDVRADSLVIGQTARFAR